MEKTWTKQAVITGTAQGIGKAAAKAFVGKGYEVWGLDIQAQAAFPHFHPVTCDLKEAKQIKAAFSKLDRIDVLVNNAAVFSQIRFADCTYEEMETDFDFNFDVNVKAAFLTSKLAADVMIKQGFGTILQVNTNHIKRCLFSVSRSEHCYDASKYAMTSLTESLAKELQPCGIQVYGLCPASTRTPMLENYFPKACLPLTKEIIGKATHYESLLEPEEVADVMTAMAEWKDQPAGHSYLLMYTEDCQRLKEGHQEDLAS
jgi:3-oxoacyl-[acyl-carrier protein] reductase